MIFGLTGASGLLGTAVARVLQETGHKVLAVRHKNPLPPTCIPVQVSLWDEEGLTEAWKEVTAILHLAGILTGSEEEFRRIHVEGTACIARVSRNLGVRMVMAGSATIYAQGEMVRGDESFPKAPADAYGWSKWLAEQELPPQACVLRLPSLISRAPCAMRESLCALLRSSIPLPRPENGGVPIELAPVQDVAEAFLLAALNPRAQGPYNISGKESPSFVEIIEAAAAALGENPNWTSPERVAPDLLRQATQSRTLSQRRAKRELGYKPECDWREVLF
ncbi:MAG TPA: NAD(P)-dependent oxidoreductase [Planctomycetes bacterium]|nr:NAD(P)-dependent oxidoreductase [Planctomycetota bacterium]